MRDGDRVPAAGRVDRVPAAGRVEKCGSARVGERIPETGRVEKRGRDHVFFIGFLGAGKSTLARNLGGMFNRHFVDTDRLVERRLGMSVTQVFKTRGESGFRVVETEVLASLRARRSLLVSCGGGIVETPRNIELMHELGYVVYLDGDFGDSMRQIKRSDTRPDFRSVRYAKRLYWHRRPLYQAAADFTVDIRGKTFTEVSYAVADLLLERGLL